MSEQIHAAADLTNTDKSSRVALPTRLERVCQAFSVATVSLQVLFIHPRESAVSPVTIFASFGLVSSFFLSASVPFLYPQYVDFCDADNVSCFCRAQHLSYHIISYHIISYHIIIISNGPFGLWFCVYISISFLLRTFKFKSKLWDLINLNNCFI